MPYFMKRAAESKDPVERIKYVMSTVFSGFYYLNLFLKPVTYSLILSSIQSSAKLSKVFTLMELKSTANKSLIIHPSVISSLLVLNNLTDTMDTMLSLHMLDLTL